MIELFRRYSAVAFIVLILLFIGLIFMIDGVGRQGVGTGPVQLKINGKSFTQSQVAREGESYSSLVQYLAQSAQGPARFGLYEFLGALEANNSSRFLAKRIILQDQAEAFGVHPDQAAVEKYLKEELFTTEEGKFDSEAYNKLITKRLPNSLGFGVSELNEIVAEILTFNKLKTLVGEGVSLSDQINEDAFKVANQKISYVKYVLPLEKVQEEVSATEEEVKAYWEENKTSYLTEPKRKISYVLADANLTVKEAQNLAEAKKSAREAGKTEEEVEKLTASLSAEAKNKFIAEAGDKIDNLFVRLQDADGESLKALADELGLEVKQSELFTKQTAPFEVKFPIYQGRGQTVVDYVFATQSAGAGMNSISDVLPIGEGRFLLFKVDEVVPAEPKPFEEARARAELDLKEKNGMKYLAEKAELAAKELNAEVSAEKLAELGLTKVEHANVAKQETVAGEPTHAVLFEEAVRLEPNQFSEVILQEAEKRAVLVQLVSNEFVQTKENENLMQITSTNQENALKQVLFRDWLEAQFDASGVEVF